MKNNNICAYCEKEIDTNISIQITRKTGYHYHESCWYERCEIMRKNRNKDDKTK